MARKQSFKKGTQNRKTRSKMAEGLKKKGYSKDAAFAIATSATKKMSAAGKKRMAKHGLRSKKGKK
jgi:hypothetical protein